MIRPFRFFALIFAYLVLARATNITKPVTRATDLEIAVRSLFLDHSRDGFDVSEIVQEARKTVLFDAPSVVETDEVLEFLTSWYVLIRCIGHKHLDYRKTILLDCTRFYAKKSLASQERKLYN